MNKTIVKTICIVLIFCMAVITFAGTLALRRSTVFLHTQIKDKIIYASESYANTYSSDFNKIEGTTDSLAAYVETTFDDAEFRRNPDGYIKEYKKYLSGYIQQQLKSINDKRGLYVTFNPEYTKDNEEVWYIYDNEKTVKVEADFMENKRDFSLPYKKDMAYFFEPQGKDRGVWIDCYYEKDLKENVFSYSKAIYVNGTFVGVAGADISAVDIIDTIQNMKLYKGGTASLLSDKYEYILSSEKSSKMKKEIALSIKKHETNGKLKNKDCFSYMESGKKYILGYSLMENGWIFAITQPESEAYAPVKSLSGMMIVLCVILCITLVAFLIAFSRPFLKKQSELEKDNKAKEIIIIDQSRQAKIGEMVGNIAHQWKQPLNTINLILANILDSYQYGDLDEDRLKKSLTKAEMVVDKLSGTISDFSDFLKPSKEKSKFRISGCIRTALALIEESINVNRIQVCEEYGGDYMCYGYENEITHVLFNALDNARDAILISNPENREILIKVDRSGEFVSVEIINRGSHIPENIIEHVFDAYYTTKEEHGGTGLGLYISKQIVEDRMNGSIALKNTADGVCCAIDIPAYTGGNDEQ